MCPTQRASGCIDTGSARTWSCDAGTRSHQPHQPEADAPISAACRTAIARFRSNGTTRARQGAFSSPTKLPSSRQSVPPVCRIMPSLQRRGRKTLSPPLKNIQPFFVMEILNRAKELERLGKDVIHLEIGEPDFPTPAPVIRKVKECLDQGQIRYTPAAGLPELREAIARYYRERYHLDLSPSRIFVTPGASGAFLLLFGMLVADGDRILLGDPGYPCYANLIRLFGGTATAIPVGPETNFHFTQALFVENWTHDTRGAILASPSNPTGTIVSRETLADLLRFSERRGGFFIADEIYHGLEYAAHSPTALEFTDEVFVVNSFSKYFGMTGWRVGWAVVPDTFVEHAERMAQNLFISAPLPSQQAALAALSQECREELDQRCRSFAERRDFLVAGLIQLGFAVPALPQGAFYVYAECSAFTVDSSEFAKRILEQAGVAITPGKDFGAHHPERYLRFSFTATIPRMGEALTRLQTFLAQDRSARAR